MEKLQSVETPWFQRPRHVEEIVGIPEEDYSPPLPRERKKTVSVALVLCLHIGVDPPDIVKPHRAARKECWKDPLACNQQKALEEIGGALQKQYERWQPRARYKQSLDPTADEVKKLCTSLRRNAKDERILFHYNGHGVPKPTKNGEIWVFNKTYTQYIPLSIFDMQGWMGSPSIYVYDCNNAGQILKSFNQFLLQQEPGHQGQEKPAKWEGDLVSLPENGVEKNFDRTTGISSGTGTDFNANRSLLNLNECIQLAACSCDQLLPMNEELPADLFTSCLTTPIRMAIHWYMLQQPLVDKFGEGLTLDEDFMEKIPGALNDRRTMLGELNWIFTAITDTIAWNCLPRDLFQKLFRQDLLVASLFRNFLLADRIMRAYHCTPTSEPVLPPTYDHPLWTAWDHALDVCLSQLPQILQEKEVYVHSSFFASQLTSFEIWLSCGNNDRIPPQQLPIVLQVLLSQVHRHRALELLGRFLDLGPWAVNLALSVGIFPYVLKLLQSHAVELRQLLALIWAKILAVHNNNTAYQNDLVKDDGHRYFLQILNDGSESSIKEKTISAFVIACILNKFKKGQEAIMQRNFMSTCTELLSDQQGDCRCPLLRQWLSFGLAKLWCDYDAARWQAIRLAAYDCLYELFDDPVPEVRAAAVFALGTLISNRSDRDEQARHIDHSIALQLANRVCKDSSPLVRRELVVALHWFALDFENVFVALVAEEAKIPHLCGSESDAGLSPQSRRTSLMDATLVAANPKHDMSIFGSLSPGGLKKSSSAKHINGTCPSLPHSLTEAGGMGHTKIPWSVLVDEGIRLAQNILGTTDTGYGAECPERQRAEEFELKMKLIASGPSLTHASQRNSYFVVWKVFMNYMFDPCQSVAELAIKVVTYINDKAKEYRRVAAASRFTPASGNSSTLNEHTCSEAKKLAMQARAVAQQSSRKSESCAVSEGVRGVKPKFQVGSPLPSEMLNGHEPHLSRSVSPAPSKTATLLLAQVQGEDCEDSGNASDTVAPLQQDIVARNSLSFALGNTRPRRIYEPSIPPKCAPRDPASVNSSLLMTESGGSTENGLDSVRIKGPLIETFFFEWCTKKFAEPILEQLDEYDSDETEMDSRDVPIRGWAKHATISQRADGVEEMTSIVEQNARFDSKLFEYRMGSKPTCLKLHPLLPLLIVGESQELTVFNIKSSRVLIRFPNRNPLWTHLSSIDIINPLAQAYIMTGTTSGQVRIWQADFPQLMDEPSGSLTLSSSGSPQSPIMIRQSMSVHDNMSLGSLFNPLSVSLDGSLDVGEVAVPTAPATIVTAWDCLSDLERTQKEHSAIYAWDEINGKLFVSGDVKVLRYWDAEREQKIQDMSLESDRCFATSLSGCMYGDRVAAVGCSDGIVRVFDFRTSRCRMELHRKLKGNVIHTFLGAGESTSDIRLTAGDESGQVLGFSLRMFQEPVFSFQLQSMGPKPKASAIQTHRCNEFLAGGTNTNTVQLWKIRDMKQIGIIRPPESQPHAMVTSLDFHKYRSVLAFAGGAENLVSVYGTQISRHERL